MSLSIVSPINQIQQDHVLHCTQNFIDRANALFNRKLPHIPVLFDLSGKSAGMFRIRQGDPEIRYNPWIFARYYESNLADTIPHEVAHYVVNQLFGRAGVRPHGSEWQNVMLAFGCRPQVTCDYDLSGLPGRKIKSFVYSCSCSEHSLSSYRHNRISRGSERYVCRRCGQKLQELNQGVSA